MWKIVSVGLTLTNSICHFAVTRISTKTANQFGCGVDVQNVKEPTSNVGRCFLGYSHLVTKSAAKVSIIF